MITDKKVTVQYLTSVRDNFFNIKKAKWEPIVNSSFPTNYFKSLVTRANNAGDGFVYLPVRVLLPYFTTDPLTPREENEIFPLLITWFISSNFLGYQVDVFENWSDTFGTVLLIRWDIELEKIGTREFIPQEEKVQEKVKEQEQDEDMNDLELLESLYFDTDSEKEERDLLGEVPYKEEMSLSPEQKKEILSVIKNPDRVRYVQSRIDENGLLSEKLFYLKKSDTRSGNAIYAFGYLLGDGRFVLCQGSVVEPTETSSCRDSVKEQRSRCYKRGIISENNVVLKPLVFDSLTAAANFVTGSKASGLDLWETLEGETIRNY